MTQDNPTTADWYGASDEPYSATPDGTTLLDPRLELLGGFVDRSHVTEGLPYWRLIAAWVTVNGSHEDAPSWVGQWLCNHLGGDHHVYGLTLSPTGVPYVEKGYRLSWPGGHADTMGKPEWDHWANAVIGPSGYDPLSGPGPYCWSPGPSGIAPGGYERLCGAGLPYVLPWLASEERVTIMGGHHVSWLTVHQLAQPEQPPTPPSEWVAIDVRIGDWIIPADISIREK